MVKKLKLSTVADFYGALNDVGVSTKVPLVNRRSLTTTAAISEVISNHFTADILEDKNEFLGVVLASIPTVIPSLASKSQKFSTYSSTFEQRGAGMPIFYKYKVLIPELEMRCLNLAPDHKTAKGQLTPAQAINTMSDVGLDVSLYNADEGVRAIQGGTLVMVNFEDLSRMKGPKIISIFKKVFDFQLGGTELPLSDKFDGAAKTTAKGVKERPKNKGKIQWKDPKRKKQRKATYTPEVTTIFNGELEKTNLLKRDAASGAALIKDGMSDFLKMKAAYEKKFSGKTIKASGYRTYERQAYFWECYKNKNCNNGNLAATPGQSNHGWGAAIDIDRSASGWTKGRAANSPEFRWLNKFGKDFNFIFTVSKANGASMNEYWHMDWVGFNKVVKGVRVKTKPGFASRPEDTHIVLAGKDTTPEGTPAAVPA